jgi:hypothetical protein
MLTSFIQLFFLVELGVMRLNALVSFIHWQFHLFCQPLHIPESSTFAHCLSDNYMDISVYI